jgi:hypothetical protein
MWISEAGTIHRWFSGAYIMRSSGHILLSLLPISVWLNRSLISWLLFCAVRFLWFFAYVLMTKIFSRLNVKAQKDWLENRSNNLFIPEQQYLAEKERTPLSLYVYQHALQYLVAHFWRRGHTNGVPNLRREWDSQLFEISLNHFLFRRNKWVRIELRHIKRSETVWKWKLFLRLTN